MNQTILLLLVGIAVIAAFVLVFIMPSNRAIANLDNEIGKAKFKTETQEKVGPIYRVLGEKLKKLDKKGSLPPPQPIPRSMLNTFNSSISSIAQKSNLSLLSVYPETLSPSDKDANTYNINLRGSFTDFRNFLKDLGNLPYIDTVQEIKINTEKGSRDFNLKVKLLVA